MNRQLTAHLSIGATEGEIELDILILVRSPKSEVSNNIVDYVAIGILDLAAS